MTKCLDFTVAIPTYNGESRLPELLERLQNQLDIQNINWEIIVIDNNSTDNTAKVVQSYQDNWQYSYPLKYYFEAKQGAAYARKRAVTEAKSELIGFLDDDNYPLSNWVVAAYNFAQKHPQVGAYGSQIHPDWEVEPPENFQKRIAPFLAITERGNLPLLYEARKKLLPPSAGLVVRRKAWLGSVPPNPILTGRVAGNMLTSEDLETLSYIQKSGWEIWYNPEMEIYHKIPNTRLQRAYLIPFFQGIGLSRYVTRMVNIKPWHQPFTLLAYMINDLRKIALHILKHRTKLKSDLVAACEMQLFLSSFVSPFYLWKNGYLTFNGQKKMIDTNEIAIKSLDITVAIPTYNGEVRLPKLLDKLFTQSGVEHLNWEIIVVDNNSSDKTYELVKNYQENCDISCTLRYFLETEQGAAFARVRAVREARGQLIAFLDDDNLPAPDWLSEAYKFGLEHPQAGAWSGQIHGEFEAKPPEKFERIQAFLAIREHGSDPYLFDADNLRLPPGAALVVRKQAWSESVPKVLFLKGRLGKSMVGGEDLEPLLYIHKAGWQIWYNPAMHTYHQIPACRLEKDYLLSLASGCGMCTFQLRLINATNWQKPIILLKTILGNLRRLLQHLVMYRGELKNNLIAIVEMEFYWASMMSPFYCLSLIVNKLAK
jgi:glycosyltransferase involved in cell wall biosynthesis